jgi:hypothetical protein
MSRVLTYVFVPLIIYCRQKVLIFQPDRTIINLVLLETVILTNILICPARSESAREMRVFHFQKQRGSDLPVMTDPLTEVHQRTIPLAVKAAELDAHEARLIELIEQDLHESPKLLSIFKRRGQHTFYVAHRDPVLSMRDTLDPTKHVSKVELDPHDSVCTVELLTKLLTLVVTHKGLSLVTVMPVPYGDDWYYQYVVDYR